MNNIMIPLPCRWQIDPRVRLAAVFMMAIAIVSLTDMAVLLLGLLVVIVFCTVFITRAGQLIRRLWVIEGFILILLLTLPVSFPGNTVIGELGHIQVTQEGLDRALLLVIRIQTMALLVIALMSSEAPHRLIAALNWYRLPPKLVQLLLLVLRYSHVLFQEYVRLRKAMRARAFRADSSWHTWQSLGWLIGMLLVKSLGRAEKLGFAMRCRGYNGHFPTDDLPGLAIKDVVTLLMFALLVSGLVLAQTGVLT